MTAIDVPPSAGGGRPVAVVTGAAGNIGQAFVRRLTAAGCRVVAVDIAADRLDSLWRGDSGVVRLAADVSTCAGADAVVEAAQGTIDVLCNVAGVGDGLYGIEELDDDRWDSIIATNQTSVFRLTRRAITPMLEAGHGVIVNLASVAGLRGGRAGIAYTASKWAIVGMTQNIAAALGPAGIRCYAICPGLISGAVTAKDLEFSPVGRERVQRDSRRPPPGTPEDVAALAMFLISNEARHLNGVAIPLDAGQLAF